MDTIHERDRWNRRTDRHWPTTKTALTASCGKNYNQ